MQIYEAISLVREEYWSAVGKFPKFNSAQECFGVLLEEVDELWEVIRKKGHSEAEVREEAIQVAAMALRFLTDLMEKPE